MEKYTIDDIKNLENIGMSIIEQIESDYRELEKNDRSKADRLKSIQEILKQGE
ncbi:MAG: hypothetical protein K2F73_06295 [Ruminococcus sp.]|nr:hypothetical protein [Ruminococcus sp.]MDE6102567.1 hypothetical protein [Ruminococcus sp.]